MSHFKNLYESALRMTKTAIVDDDYPEVSHRFMSALNIVENLPEMPKVVCLCGSTKFLDAFKQAEFDETLKGHIVLTIGCDSKSDDELFQGPDAVKIKEQLDYLHKRKIDLADEVLILNVGGYIGKSTQSELDWAKRTGKFVRFLEN